MVQWFRPMPCSKMIGILFVLFSAAVYAVDCPEVNLYKKKDSPLLKQPIYDQDGAGICYAYASADLINYELAEQGNDQLKVDPVWAAYTFSSKWRHGLTDGGITAQTIRSLNREGICPPDKVQSQLNEFAQSTGLNGPEIIYFLETYFEELSKINADKKNVMNDEDKFDTAYANAYINVKAYHPEVLQCVEKFEQHLMTIDLLHKNVFKVFAKNIFSNCDKKTVNKNYHFNVNGLLTHVMPNEMLNNKIRSVLSEESGPVAIGYCANVLTDKNYDGIMSVGARIPKNGCLSHESSLVGSRTKDGQCQFLLRNSWGSYWGSWTKNWSCSCQNKKTLEVFDDCTAEKNPGHQFSVLGCWLPAEQIVKNLDGATWISK